MSNRGELIRRVYVRAHVDRDVIPPLEVEQLLNDGQDRFTERTAVIKRDMIVSLTSGTGSYPLITSGRVGSILSAQINDGSSDLYPLVIVASPDLAMSVPTWRTDTGVPTHLFRGWDPGKEEASREPVRDRVWLYPVINASGYTLRLLYVLLTLRQLKDDSLSPLIGDRWEDSLLDYATAEIFLRRAMDAAVSQELATRFIAMSQVYRDRFETAVAEAQTEVSSHQDAEVSIEPRRF